MSGLPGEVQRALYVERNDNEFLVWDFTQEVPEGPTTCAGPLPLSFDSDQGRFLLPGGRSPAEDIPMIYKNFLLVLTTLRELSETPLPRPTPDATTDGRSHYLSLQGGRKLVRTESPAAPFPIYLLSPPPDTEPFDRKVVLRNVGPWRTVAPEEVQQTIDKGIKQRS